MKRKKYFLADPSLPFEKLLTKAKEKGFEVSGKKRRYLNDSEGQQHLINLENGMVIGFSSPSYIREGAVDRNGEPKKAYFQRVTEIGRFFEHELGYVVVRTQSQAYEDADARLDFEPQDNSLPPIEIELDLDAGVREYDGVYFKQFAGRGDEVYQAYIDEKLEGAAIGLTSHEKGELVRQCRDLELTSYGKLKTAIEQAVGKDTADILEIMKARVNMFSHRPNFDELNEFLELVIDGFSGDGDALLSASVILHKQEDKYLNMFLIPVEEMLPKLYKVHFKNFEK